MRFPDRLIRQTTPTRRRCDETRETDLQRVHEGDRSGQHSIRLLWPRDLSMGDTGREKRRFGLKDCPMVHLDESGEIDCYFTETGATVCSSRGITSLRKRSPMSKEDT